MAAAKALGGLGGVGKTELAREFGWRNQSAYAGVWWIEAETRDGLLNGLSSLGRASIGASARRGSAKGPLAPLWSRSSIAAWKSLGFSSTTTRENPAAIDGWMPRAGAHCLITSRWRDWTGEADALDVDVFPPDVAVDYLFEASGRMEPKDREQAAALAKELAICRSRSATRPPFAGRAIPTSKTISKSWPAREGKPDRRLRAGKDYPWSVYETFELGLERVLAGQPEFGVPPQPRAEG